MERSALLLLEADLGCLSYSTSTYGDKSIRDRTTVLHLGFFPPEWSQMLTGVPFVGEIEISSEKCMLSSIENDLTNHM